jgi:hypothetical protein
LFILFFPVLFFPISELLGEKRRRDWEKEGDDAERPKRGKKKKERLGERGRSGERERIKYENERFDRERRKWAVVR